MKNSIRSKMSFGFLVFAFMTITIIGFFNLHFFKQKAEINKIYTHLNDIHITVLKDFKSIEGFFRYETSNSLFFENQKSNYLTEHYEFQDEIAESIELIKKSNNGILPNISTQIDSLHKELNLFSKTFEDLLTYIIKRGFKDYGLIGQMREEIHKLESLSGEFRNYYLSLRRHEKDYLIRNEAEYRLKLKITAQEFIQFINHNSSISDSRKKELINIVGNYEKIFDAIVDLDNQFGIKVNNNIKRELDNIANSIEYHILTLEHKTKLISDNTIRRLKLIYILLALISITISILISYILIKRIIDPLNRVTKYISAFVNNNFKIKHEIDFTQTDKEVKIIFTEFKNMIDQLDHREKLKLDAINALSQSEKRYREMADLLPIGVFETDLDGNISYANRFWYNLFEFKLSNDIQNLNIRDILRNLNEPIEELILLNKQECIATSKSMHETPVLVYINEIRSHNIKKGFRGAIIDITERKRYIEALILEKIKAEESDKLKSSFLANMSHEIRTPLNAIIGFSDLLADSSFDKERQSEFIKHIKNSGETLLNLINDIIDIAKVEAGELKIKKSNVSVNEIIHELYLTYFEKIKRTEKNIELKIFEYKQENFTIKTDQLRLKQILANLLNNAVKFTSEGYIEFGYEFTTDNHIIFFVRDTGTGIHPDQLETIFERFRQVEDNKSLNIDGAGLGLAITKNLVELLGGEIWVESEEYIGSVFYFTLPFKKIKESDQPLISITEAESIRLDGHTLLIAEDNTTNYLYLRDLLISKGARIYRVMNGEEAVCFIENNNFVDLILMDIQMPVMDGITATRQIKENFKIPIIAQTAYAMSDERKKFLKAGFDDYIAKPINKTILIGKIKQLLDLPAYAQNRNQFLNELKNSTAN